MNLYDTREEKEEALCLPGPPEAPFDYDLMRARANDAMAEKAGLPAREEKLLLEIRRRSKLK